MIKSILLGLNLLILLLVGSFQKTDPKIVQDIPASLNPGEEAEITVSIDKSDITGFAKFQINLAPGLIAESIDNAGASFTFNDHKVKFIWMALPTDKTFTLKYRIVAEQNAVGDLTVDGRFSYIYENERKNYDVPEQIISVGAPEAIAAQRIKDSIESKASNSTATATLHRNIASIGINQWRVDISLHKSDLQGFAKIEENIPDGYTVIDLKASSAVFSVDDKTIKYIWYDIPENEDVLVTYKMLPVIAMDGFTPVITGDFSYLKNEETVSMPIEGGVEDIAEQPDEILAQNADTSAAKVVDQTEVPPAEVPADEIANNIEKPETDITPEAAVIAVSPVISGNIDSNNTASKEIAETKPETKTPVETQTKAQVPPVKEPDVQETAEASANKSLTDANIVDVPAPETGIFYRVQIAAGKNNLKQPVFAKIYRFDEKFNIENQNGLFKYTTGHFQIYKAARDGRERITTKYDKFQGPFVTAYNSGDRITVQEALMITNQRWYQ